MWIGCGDEAEVVLIVWSMDVIAGSSLVFEEGTRMPRRRRRGGDLDILDGVCFGTGSWVELWGCVEGC